MAKAISMSMTKGDPEIKDEDDPDISLERLR
jgi:hypothetical protein